MWWIAIEYWYVFLVPILNMNLHQTFLCIYWMIIERKSQLMCCKSMFRETLSNLDLKKKMCLVSWRWYWFHAIRYVAKTLPILQKSLLKCRFKYTNHINIIILKRKQSESYQKIFKHIFSRIDFVEFSLWQLFPKLLEW